MNSLKQLAGYLPWAGLAILAVLLMIVSLRVVARLISWRRLLKRQMVSLELVPPAFTPVSAQATQKLFAILHGLRTTGSLTDKLLGCQTSFALEMVSTRESGICYLIQIEKRLAATTQQLIRAYLPGAKVKIIPKEPDDLTQGIVIEFKQSGHYAFPLAPQTALDDHDPTAYLTNAMTQLKSGESIRFQMVLTPIKLREAADLTHKILTNDDLLGQLSQPGLPWLTKISNGLAAFSFGLMDLVSETVHPTSSGNYSSQQKQAYDRLQVAQKTKPARTLSSFEQELVGSIHRKVSQPLFQVSLRSYLNMDSAVDTDERLNVIKSALESYSVPSYQSLSQKLSYPYSQRIRRFNLQKRLPSIARRFSCILSASEIAGLYHFPINKTSRTDNLVTSFSRTLAAPVSLKQNSRFDVVIGRNYHHGSETDIGLTEAERERHIYIIGGTGNGKTTMLQYMIDQDMRNGKGLAVIDPHGDMAETILRLVPENRVKDVIYFNPDDIGHPIGLNLLELPGGLSEDDTLREKDLITESVVSVFRKIFSEDDSGGHRVEYVLRNTVQTALTIKDATLFTVFDLLNDSYFRRSVIKTLENKDLVNFWRNEMGKAGEMQRIKMAAGVTSKIGRFLFSASAKRILEQPKSTIDFDDIINSGKILICNLSKGLLGEDTSELFGITVLAKLQLASLRRARMLQTDRKPFYLYVDEFQNFATASFVQMLSESRKYKMFITMAEQSTSQQKDKQMVSVILANVGTVVCFRTGNPLDEQLLLPLFAPYIQDSEISNLSSYDFYARLSAIKSQEPVSGQTILLNDDGDATIAEKVKNNSQNLYGLTPKAASDIKPETVPLRHTANKVHVGDAGHKQTAIV